MDIKKSIDQVVDKIKNDPSFLSTFQSDPEKAIESVLGVDIPDGVANQVIDGVKAKVSVDKLGGIADTVKGLFK